MSTFLLEVAAMTGEAAKYIMGGMAAIACAIAVFTGFSQGIGEALVAAKAVEANFYIFLYGTTQEVIASEIGTPVIVAGTVVAENGQGFIIKDTAGLLNVFYKNYYLRLVLSSFL